VFIGSMGSREETNKLNIISGVMGGK